jgi:hypothetical protein
VSSHAASDLYEKRPYDLEAVADNDVRADENHVIHRADVSD